jgi:chromobox protein 1
MTNQRTRHWNRRKTCCMIGLLYDHSLAVVLTSLFSEGAEEILEEYFRCLGGRPQKPEKPAKKRKLTSEARSTPEKALATRTRKSKGANGTETPEGSETVPDWVPRGKSWEKDVAAIETIIRDPETGGLVAFLQWENGRKSRVSVEQCYEKCPMRVRSSFLMVATDTDS